MDDGFPNIYVPLRVDWDEYDPAYAAVFNDGYCSFNVERLMFGELERLVPEDGIQSYEVTYYQDGQQLFDPYIIEDPWEMAMFGMPMVTHGTITTGGDRLVTG